MTSFFIGCTNYTDLITQILMEVMFVMQQSEVNPFLSTAKSVALKSPAKRSSSPIRIRFDLLDLSHYFTPSGISRKKIEKVAGKLRKSCGTC